ncbi:SPOR domain-containing protein [Teredinibacter haidensis]|uniref:SPOR domain-containing protein n=1 Tax=Teredinibacter haidensis TaxID=2731755 RepID=UPI000948A424|nr:AAA family ATPase [Teredinibacter haidensis]
MDNQELDLVIPKEGVDQPQVGYRQGPVYFATPGRQVLIDQILHLLQFGEGLPVIVGAAGAGKTCFLNELKSHLEHLPLCVNFCAESDADLQKNLALITARLGVSIGAMGGPGEMLAALRHFSQSLTAEQKQAVLIIDNAHLLDDSTLGALISLVQGQEQEAAGYGLVLLLAAQSGLVERLDELQLLEVPVYDFEMPLLSAAELRAFFSDLGLEWSGRLDDEALNSLWAKSMGNPGVALGLLESMVGAGESRSKTDSAKGKTFGLPLGHIVAMLVLVSVLIWALTSQNISETPKLVLSPTLSSGQLTEERKVPEKVQALGSVSSESAAKEGIDLTGSVEIVGGLAAGTSPEAAEIVVVPAKPAFVASARNNVAPTPTPSPTPAPFVESLAFEYDELFLLSRSSGEYTLQVLVASREASLQSYMARQANRKSLYVYEGLRKGERRAIVLAGVYASRSAALNARDQLPAEQRTAGPWPRSLKDIKQEIDAIRRN